MSLIKPKDRGRTWSRDEQTNDEHPVWTSPKFSTAFFFKYGQNGGDTRQDDQDQYVYAISNPGPDAPSLPGCLLPEGRTAARPAPGPRVNCAPDGTYCLIDGFRRLEPGAPAAAP